MRGAWVRGGTHVDLVGAFTREMRESDDDLVARAEVFVDTYAGALKEAGDLVQPIDEGAITREHVRAELAELASGTHAGRADRDAVTLFKSVGTALEDLCAARLVSSGAVERYFRPCGPGPRIARILPCPRRPGTRAGA